MSLIPVRIKNYCSQIFAERHYTIDKLNNAAQFLAVLEALSHNEDFYISTQGNVKCLTFLGNVRWWRKIWVRISFQLPLESEKTRFLASYINTNSYLLSQIYPPLRNGTYDKNLNVQQLNTHYRFLKLMKRRYRSSAEVCEAIRNITDNLKLIRNGNFNFAKEVLSKPRHNKENELAKLQNEINEFHNDRVQQLRNEIIAEVRETEALIEESKRIVMEIPTHKNVGERLASDSTQHNIIVLCQGDRNNPEDIANKTVTAPQFLFDKADLFNNSTIDAMSGVKIRSPVDNVERKLIQLDYSAAALRALVNHLYGVAQEIDEDVYPELLSLANFLGQKDAISWIEENIIRTQISTLEQALFWSNEESLREQDLPITPLIQKHAAEILAKNEVSQESLFEMTHLGIANYLASPYLRKEELVIAQLAYEWCYNKVRQKHELTQQNNDQYEQYRRDQRREADADPAMAALNAELDRVNAQLAALDGVVPAIHEPAAIPLPPDFKHQAIQLFHAKIQDVFPQRISDSIRFERLAYSLGTNFALGANLAIGNVFVVDNQHVSVGDLTPPGELAGLMSFNAFVLELDQLPSYKRNPIKNGFTKTNETKYGVEFTLWFQAGLDLYTNILESQEFILHSRGKNLNCKLKLTYSMNGGHSVHIDTGQVPVDIRPHRISITHANEPNKTDLVLYQQSNYRDPLNYFDILSYGDSLSRRLRGHHYGVKLFIWHTAELPS